MDAGECGCTAPARTAPEARDQQELQHYLHRNEEYFSLDVSEVFNTGICAIITKSNPSVKPRTPKPRKLDHQ